MLERIMSFKKLFAFFTEMESGTQRAVWIAFALFTVAGLVLSFGMAFVNLNTGELANFLRSLRGVWWSPIAVTLMFVVLAFIGAPQFVLIAATVSVFGVIEGSILSWIATMISASVGFSLGKIGGSGALEKIIGNRGGRILKFIGKNGFIASFIVRQVPSGPFIIINLALGASNIEVLPFLSGTGIGILPKILLVGFGAHGLSQVISGKGIYAIGFFILAIAVWLLIVFVLRPILIKYQNR